MPRTSDLSFLSSLPSNISDEKHQGFVTANARALATKFLLTRDDFDFLSTRSEQPPRRLAGQPSITASASPTSHRESRRHAQLRRPLTTGPASKKTVGRQNTRYVELIDVEEEGAEEEEEQQEEEQEEEEEAVEELEEGEEDGQEEEEEEEEEEDQDVPEAEANKQRVREALRNFVLSSERTARAEVEMRLALYEMIQHGVENVEPEPEPEPEVVPGPSRRRGVQATKSTPAKAKPKTTKKTAKGKGKATGRARERDIEDLISML